MFPFRCVSFSVLCSPECALDKIDAGFAVIYDFNVALLGGFLRNFKCHYENTYNIGFLHYMAFGRVWQHAKSCYGVWERFVHQGLLFH